MKRILRLPTVYPHAAYAKLNFSFFVRRLKFPSLSFLIKNCSHFVFNGIWAISFLLSLSLSVLVTFNDCERCNKHRKSVTELLTGDNSRAIKRERRKTLKSFLEWHVASGNRLLQQIDAASHSPPHKCNCQSPPKADRTSPRETARTSSGGVRHPPLAPLTAGEIHTLGRAVRVGSRACPVIFPYTRRPSPAVPYLKKRVKSV